MRDQHTNFGASTPEPHLQSIIFWTLEAHAFASHERFFMIFPPKKKKKKHKRCPKGSSQFFDSSNCNVNWQLLPCNSLFSVIHLYQYFIVVQLRCKGNDLFNNPATIMPRSCSFHQTNEALRTKWRRDPATRNVTVISALLRFSTNQPPRASAVGELANFPQTS